MTYLQTLQCSFLITIYSFLTVAQPSKGETNVACKDLTTGKQYLPGEGWDINDCVSCFCSNDGQQVCHEIKCSASKCKNPVHLQGRCCPVCPEVFHSGKEIITCTYSLTDTIIGPLPRI